MKINENDFIDERKKRKHTLESDHVQYSLKNIEMASYELLILTKARATVTAAAKKKTHTHASRFELGNGVKLKDISPMNSNEIVYEVRIYRGTS